LAAIRAGVAADLFASRSLDDAFALELAEADFAASSCVPVIKPMVLLRGRDADSLAGLSLTAGWSVVSRRAVLGWVMRVAFESTVADA
jgi:hypothetical protein